MFIGFDEDGTALYDTKEAAIERAKQLVEHGGDPDAIIYVYREHIPRWFRDLVQGIPVLQLLAYKRLKES